MATEEEKQTIYEAWKQSLKFYGSVEVEEKKERLWHEWAAIEGQQDRDRRMDRDAEPRD